MPGTPTTGTSPNHAARTPPAPAGQGETPKSQGWQHQPSHASLRPQPLGDAPDLGHVGLGAERGRALAVRKAVHLHAGGAELAAHFLAGFGGRWVWGRERRRKR